MCINGRNCAINKSIFNNCHIIAFRYRINSRCPGYTNYEFFIVSNQIRFNDNLWRIRSMTL